jgi:hypothetical protein
MAVITALRHAFLQAHQFSLSQKLFHQCCHVLNHSSLVYSESISQTKTSWHPNTFKHLKKKIEKALYIMTNFTQQSPDEENDCPSSHQAVPSHVLNPGVRDSVSQNSQVESPKFQRVTGC